MVGFEPLNPHLTFDPPTGGEKSS